MLTGLPATRSSSPRFLNSVMLLATVVTRNGKKVFPFLVTMLQQFSMSHLYWLCLSCVFFGKWSSNSSQYWLDVLGYCISSPQLWHIHQYFFNRDLNCVCLIYMFSLRFSGSKFFINLRRQFPVRKILSVYVKFFLRKVSRGLQSFHFMFKIHISKMRNFCCQLLFY